MKGEKYLFVVSGPSGTGKDTVVAKLLGKHPEIEKTVSATTRTMREGEVNGKNYHFLTKEQFETALAEGNIVESTPAIAKTITAPCVPKLSSIWSSRFRLFW